MNQIIKSVHHIEMVARNVTKLKFHLENVYKFLDIGRLEKSKYVLQSNKCKIILSENSSDTSDGVTDICFEVKDVKYICDKVKELGRGRVVHQPSVLNDIHGAIEFAVIESCVKNIYHTILNKQNYSSFLPRFESHSNEENGRISNIADYFDHFAIACDSGESKSIITCEEENPFGFVVKLGSTGMLLKAIDTWKCSAMAIADSLAKSNGGPGVQHFAFSTKDILKSVAYAKRKGERFIEPPDFYYQEIESKLNLSKIGLDRQLLSDSFVLIDTENDEENYLLQIFTQPVFENDTLFLELIQRHNAQGFGEGNILSLWRAVEKKMIQDRLKGACK